LLLLFAVHGAWCTVLLACRLQLADAAQRHPSRSSLGDDDT
jgi:hypothetical protein